MPKAPLTRQDEQDKVKEFLTYSTKRRLDKYNPDNPVYPVRNYFAENEEI